MAGRVGFELQRRLFEDVETDASAKASSTFVNNMSLPIHRWFRYSAGFSALWVREVIQSAKAKLGNVRLLDPFAGSGTVLVEAARAGVPSFGVESHPFVARVARIKANTASDPTGFREYTRAILKHATKIVPEIEGYSPLIRKCYPDEPLAKLDQLKQAWLGRQDDPHADLGWLALAAILRECSPVGTANWQYVLPKKTKSKSRHPFEAYKARADQFCLDMAQAGHSAEDCTLLQGDARELIGVPDDWASLVITSPPYPNNFDYADATRLEMTFFGEIAGWGDLQATVRKHLVRSCTQHVAPLVSNTAAILASSELDPIRPEIESVVAKLDEERHAHGGKKNYHTMIAAYFLDIAKVWRQLRRVTSANSTICFVIGDSAPYGIHVAVDSWMSRLALAARFRSCSFEKTRDRNLKWKNRKHRVPLHEGRLWVEG